MLEEKIYTKAEISEILNIRDNQGIIRKLRSYNIKYSSFGRGNSLTVKIIYIPDKFKVFCITKETIPKIV
jgi:hypothetical protein